MRRTTIADSRRSPRYFGKILPVLGSPTWWPARPTRCMPRATEPGDSTSTTRSTVPMSMPSSRLEVATMARNRPSFSSDSTRTRCSRASDPWCARTSSSPASSFRLAARRSARRLALQKTIVVRCARMSSRIRGCTCGQMLWVASASSSPSADAVAPDAAECAPGSFMSSTGTITSTSSGLREPASTTVTGRGAPPRSRRGTVPSRRAGVASPTTRCVAAGCR